MSGFIAVHVGAGLHSDQLRPSYKKTCQSACRAALKLLREGCTSTQAITAAVSILEDCPLTNAGTGSNLSLSGSVECDAGIMEGSGMNFGSVGALSNVKNPIQVAEKILELQTVGLSCGRVPPCTLVGKGAADWAVENGVQRVEEAELVTGSAARSYNKNMALLKQHDEKSSLKRKQSWDMEDSVVQNQDANVQSSDSEVMLNKARGTVINIPAAKRKRSSASNNSSRNVSVEDDWVQKTAKTNSNCDSELQTSPDNDFLLDTVGAVCVDSYGTVSSAVSSGGLLLKTPGRIGQAAIYGSGCWAQNSASGGIACSVTGVGEYLITTMFARECYNAMRDSEDCLLAEDHLREGNSTVPNDNDYITHSVLPSDTTDNSSDTRDVSALPSDTRNISSFPCGTRDISALPTGTRDLSAFPTDTKAALPSDTRGNSALPRDTRDNSTLPIHARDISAVPSDTRDISALPSDTLDTSALPSDTMDISASPSDTRNTSSFLNNDTRDNSASPTDARDISALPNVFRNKFLDSPHLKGKPSKLAGVLTLRYSAGDRVCELAWAHNTKTMVLGYGSTSGKVVSLVSELPTGKKIGESVVGGEQRVRLGERTITNQLPIET